MLEVALDRDLPYPAERVWAVLEDFGNMAWTGAPEVEVIGEGIGMIRRVLMPGMEPIDEVLQQRDAATMTFRYSIPRGLPMPVTDYVAGATVEALPDGTARVHWSCRCTPADETMSRQDIEALIQSAYAGLLDGLEAHLAAQG